MAQKSSMDGALMLEKKEELDIIHSSRDSFVSFVKLKKLDGLYMVGLSNHVGFVYKTSDKLFFIHSSYIFPGNVVCESARESEALGYSKIFVLADITHNKALMIKWLKKEILPH